MSSEFPSVAMNLVTLRLQRGLSVRTYLVAAFLLWLHLVLVAEFAAAQDQDGACSVEELAQTSNCSFQYNENQDTVLCTEHAGHTWGYALGRCPSETPIYEEGNVIPGEVNEMEVKFIYTTRPRTIMNNYSVHLMASSCHLNCNSSDADVHIGFNISFQAEPWAAEDLWGYEISLIEDLQHTVRCHWILLDQPGLTRAAAQQHVFYFDGFIGASPGLQYTIDVTPLPTDSRRSNARRMQVDAPRETCWTPDVIVHDTPSALNLTLLQDSRFSVFSIILYEGIVPPTKKVDFNNTELYSINGRQGANVFFGCHKPTADGEPLKVFVVPKECPYCEWNVTEVVVKGWKPDIIYHPTPFAVNVTLLQDDASGFSAFTLVVRGDMNITKHIDFKEAELYRVNGKWGTNIVFDCQEPRDVELLIHPDECSCCEWNLSHISVQGAPPSFKDCPSRVVKQVELGSVNTAVSVDWPLPVPVFLEPDCQTGWNSSHQPLRSFFAVNATTRVSYHAWQYSMVASCFFDVTVALVDTTPPAVDYCPADITVVAEMQEDSLPVSWDQPRATDQSPITIQCSHENGSLFTVGDNTTVRCALEDSHGNRARDCVFFVVLLGKPTASLPLILACCVSGAVIALISGFIYYRKCSVGNKADSAQKFQTSNKIIMSVPEQDVKYPNILDIQFFESTQSVTSSHVKNAEFYTKSNSPPQRSSSESNLSSGFHSGEPADVQESFGRAREAEERETLLPSHPPYDSNRTSTTNVELDVQSCVSGSLGDFGVSIRDAYESAS